jgi:hypothetical protein
MIKYKGKEWSLKNTDKEIFISYWIKVKMCIGEDWKFLLIKKKINLQ